MIEEIFRKKKIKVTKQRLQVLSFVIEHNSFSIKDIIESYKDINQSTIYRILTLLEDKKIIIKVINNQEIYYKFNNNHKHYIECIKCHEKEMLEECPYNNIDLKGFKIKDDEVIKGICKNCQNEEKIGLFVGSFNPPTKAHFEIGNSLLNENYLNKIIYVPCNNLKKTDLIEISDRYNMLMEMTKNNFKMLVDDLKIIDDYKNFNYKDLDLLQRKYNNNNFYIIIGSDNLINLYKWDNYEYMLQNNYFIVINRFQNNDLDIIENKYIKYKDKFIIIDYNNDISSTKAREMVKVNRNLNNILENNVISYINNNNLYQ